MGWFVDYGYFLWHSKLIRVGQVSFIDNEISSPKLFYLRSPQNKAKQVNKKQKIVNFKISKERMYLEAKPSEWTAVEAHQTHNNEETIDSIESRAFTIHPSNPILAQSLTDLLTSYYHAGYAAGRYDTLLKHEKQEE